MPTTRASISATRMLKKLVEKSNKELTGVDNWLIANKLTLNVSKTNFILFRTPKSREIKVNPVVFLRGKQIERVTSTKFLGVYVDPSLKHRVCQSFNLRRLCLVRYNFEVKMLSNSRQSHIRHA